MERLWVCLIVDTVCWAQSSPTDLVFHCLDTSLIHSHFCNKCKFLSTFHFLLFSYNICACVQMCLSKQGKVQVSEKERDEGVWSLMALCNALHVLFLANTHPLFEQTPKHTELVFGHIGMFFPSCTHKYFQAFLLLRFCSLNCFSPLSLSHIHTRLEHNDSFLLYTNTCLSVFE